jgi:hydroxylamine reductase
MAGCDGRMPSRKYYTEFARSLPEDCIILTAGCAKYRYNKVYLSPNKDLPRLLDAGQCNDCYSLIVFAEELRKDLGLKNLNDLPLVFNIAWYEQKAVIVLLALLALGVKKIHLGPTLPAFLSPNVLKVLQDKFLIGGIDTVESDLKTFLA